MITFMKVLHNYKLPPRIGMHYSIGFVTIFYTGVQILTGVVLTLRTNFNSPWDNYFKQKGLLIQNPSFYMCQTIHMVGVTFVFVFLYLHMIKNLMINTYKVITWNIGVLLLVAMMGTAAFGYCIFGGQLAVWSFIVISRLICGLGLQRAIVMVFYGKPNFVSLQEGMIRIFSLHFLFAMASCFLIFVHLFYLHLLGTTGKLGISTRCDDYSMTRFI